MKKVVIIASMPESSRSIPAPCTPPTRKSYTFCGSSSTASETQLTVSMSVQKQFVSRPLSTHIEIHSIIPFLRMVRRRLHRRHKLHLRQINVSLTIGILHRVVIPQLVLYRVQDEPALLPALQQCPLLVQMPIKYAIN